MKRLKVICKSCEGSRVIEIHKTAMGERIDWLEDNQEGAFTIISGRKRLDNQFGFQCICGNNDLMTSQEKKAFSTPASPKPQEINEVAKNLIIDPPCFNLVSF